MKNVGKQFEADFKASIPSEVYHLKIPDAAGSFPYAQDSDTQENDSTQAMLRFSLKSPYDFILCKNGHMYALETKSSGTSSFSFEGKSCNIKMWQVENLIKAKESGATAGLVLNFRKYDETYFVDASDFYKAAHSTHKKSLNISEIRPIGILLPEKKLKVHYRYDLDPIFAIVGGTHDQRP